MGGGVLWGGGCCMGVVWVVLCGWCMGGVWVVYGCCMGVV